MIMPNFMFSGEFAAFEDVLKERFPNVKRFKKGDIIIGMNDDRSKNCYYVLSGTASYILHHENGGTKISSLRSKGTIFPLYYTYSSTNMESSLEMTALSDMVLIDIPKKELYDLMVEIPEVAIAMCDAYGKYTTLLLYEISSQLFESANNRVCSYIYIQHLSSDNIINMTHEDIGEATGVTRATVSRILSTLKKKGIISTSRSHIKVESSDDLLDYCSYMAYPSE